MTLDLVSLYVLVGMVWAVFAFAKIVSFTDSGGFWLQLLGLIVNVLMWPLCAPLGIYRWRTWGK